MINKLRRKFIAVSILSVLIVLLVIMFSINYMNFRSIVLDADRTLETIADNGGTFPEGPGEGAAERPEERSSGAPGDQARSKPADLDFKERGERERPFDTRYFTFTFDENGKVTDSNVKRIAAISSSQAKAYAVKVYKSGKEKGFSDSYRYLRTEEDGKTMLIFTDCYRGLSNFRSFLFYSILVSLGGLLAVLILVLFLSNRAVKPVAESYEKQKQFITDAGHELKTPLAVIDADCKVMEMESGKNEWLDDIRTQTSRLADLTGELVYLSRMDEGRKIGKIEFPVSDVAEDMAASFSARAKAGGKAFDHEIEKGITYEGDQQMVSELISILLDNAFKYSGENGKVKASLKRYQKGVIISVTNTAAGLTPEKVEHLFDRFYRADESRSAETPGYGLGLSIAKAVCEAHSGSIKAELNGDDTITFTALLP